LAISKAANKKIVPFLPALLKAPEIQSKNCDFRSMSQTLTTLKITHERNSQKINPILMILFEQK